MDLTFIQILFLNTRNVSSISEGSFSSEDERPERTRFDTFSEVAPAEIIQPQKGTLLSETLHAHFFSAPLASPRRDALGKAKKLKNLITRSSSKKPKENLFGENPDSISFGRSSSDENISKSDDELGSSQELSKNGASKIVIDDPSLVILIHASKRKSKNFEQCLKNSKFNEYIVNSPEISEIFSKLEDENPQNPTKIAICGGDAFINSVLRAHVEHVLKSHQNTHAPQFFIIPIGGKNGMAVNIASLDPTYKTHFFGNWTDILEKEEDLTSSQSFFFPNHNFDLKFKFKPSLSISFTFCYSG